MFWLGVDLYSNAAAICFDRNADLIEPVAYEHVGYSWNWLRLSDCHFICEAICLSWKLIRPSQLDVFWIGILIESNGDKLHQLDIIYWN